MPLPSEPTKEDKGEDVNPGHSLYMRPDIALLDEKQWRYVQRRYHISPRELEVAKLICRGFVNGDVAKKLNVKPGTVKTHLRSIFAKTHAKNRIIMLLRFMDDANKIFNKSPVAPPVHIVDKETPTANMPPSVETLKEDNNSSPPQ